MRFEGASAPAKAAATLHTITAAPLDKASIEQPDKYPVVSKPLTYAKDLAVDLDPYTVAVIEIRAQ